MAHGAHVRVRSEDGLVARRLRLDQLDAAVIALWRSLHADSPSRSPLTSYEFACLADAAHGDVEVIHASAGQACALLPLHLRANCFARPLGGSFSDVHGPLATPGFPIRGEDLLRVAGVSAYRFDGLEDPQGLFANAVSATDSAYAIVLGGATPEAYLETRRVAHPRRVGNFRKLEAKLIRDGGRFELIAPDASAEHFETLMAWKRAHIQRTGRYDVFRAPANRRLIDLVRGADGPLSGLLMTLTFNGQPIAAQFGVRLGDRFHPWIAAYDPEARRLSPGMMFLIYAIRAMPGLGLDEINLSRHHGHYKDIYAAHVRMLASGVAFGGGLAAAAERAGEAIGQGLERLPARSIASAAARLRRRADLIASAETRLPQRTAALAQALVQRAFVPATPEEDVRHAA